MHLLNWNSDRGKDRLDSQLQLAWMLMETFPNRAFPTAYLHFLKRFPSERRLCFSAQQLFSFKKKVSKTFLFYLHGPSLHACVSTMLFVFYICHSSHIMRQRENVGGTCSNESYYLTAASWLLSHCRAVVFFRIRHVHAFKAHKNRRDLFVLGLSVRKRISSFFWKNSWRDKSACLATTLV